MTKRAVASEESSVSQRAEHGDEGAVARDERDECLSKLGARETVSRD